MKKFIGTKQVEAEPMTMGDAYEKGLLQVGRVPNESEKTLPGYHVKYTDGYESWSPAEPFEKAYRCAETFLDRLKIEHKECFDRFEKCNVFVNSEKFREILKDDYSAFLLYVQRILMGYYTEILELRMDSAEGKEIPSVPRMSLGIAIEALKFGLAIRRKGWNGKGLFVVKQVPAHIESDVVPKVQSLPQSAKDLILKGKGFVDYTSQCLIYNENTGRADSWVPSVSDMFAEDWEIVL